LAKVYRKIMEITPVHRVYIWMWDSFCQPKHKVFFWLLLKDRLSTSSILRTKNMHLDSYNCVLCNLLEEETVEHLCLFCPFARDCGELLNIDIPMNDSDSEYHGWD
jgi:hypothetical protein